MIFNAGGPPFVRVSKLRCVKVSPPHLRGDRAIEKQSARLDTTDISPKNKYLTVRSTIASHSTATQRSPSNAFDALRMHASNGTNGVSHASNGVAEPKSTDKQVKVAVVGGGIVGCVTALGLLKRGISVKLYEQARSFREIGAGLAFTTNAQTCMKLTDPDVLAAMKVVSTKNELGYYTYVDGYHAQSDDPKDMSEKELFRLFAGKTGFDGCHRAHFLDELVKLIPEGVVEFQKRLQSYDIGSDDEEAVTLKFEDGTSATADAGELKSGWTA